MGGLNIRNLIADARSAGLQIRLDGDLLRINGPRKATAIAKELLDRKREVIEILTPRPEPIVSDLGLLATTDRIRFYRERYHPAPVFENIEMHDSAIFDVVVEVDFYDGRRMRIPQQSTPAGWTSPF